jgi:hypothetical protein
MTTYVKCDTCKCDLMLMSSLNPALKHLCSECAEGRWTEPGIVFHSSASRIEDVWEDTIEE